MIVFRTEMREYDVLGASVVLFTDEPADGSIGKMSIPSHQPLLQCPRIRSDPEHLEVMIRFENQYVRPEQLFCDLVRHVADIGQLRELCSAASHCKCNRFGCVVRDAERQNLEVA